MEPRNGTTKENREAKRNLHRADPNEEREKYLSGPPPYAIRSHKGDKGLRMECHYNFTRMGSHALDLTAS